MRGGYRFTGKNYLIYLNNFENKNEVFEALNTKGINTDSFDLNSNYVIFTTADLNNTGCDSRRIDYNLIKPSDIIVSSYTSHLSFPLDRSHWGSRKPRLKLSDFESIKDMKSLLKVLKVMFRDYRSKKDIGLSKVKTLVEEYKTLTGNKGFIYFNNHFTMSYPTWHNQCEIIVTDAVENNIKIEFMSKLNTLLDSFVDDVFVYYEDDHDKTLYSTHAVYYETAKKTVIGLAETKTIDKENSIVDFLARIA